MSEFDLDRPVDRRDSDCAKWAPTADGEVLPLWVADMDFPAAPAVRAAVARRAAHGIFGYAAVPARWYRAVCDWVARDRWTVSPEQILPVPGVIPGLAAVLQALSLPGDRVVIPTPAYPGFFAAVRNSGAEPACCPLRLAGTRYELDWDRLERELSAPRARFLLWCHPHNPTGRMWTTPELRQVQALCRRRGVLVIADEIHCDLRPAGCEFVPYASLGAEFAADSVTLRSPSKTFNLAGLQCAYIICADAARRERINRQININEICDLNPFGIDALIAAYTEGAGWLAAVNAYIRENYLSLRRAAAASCPDLIVMPMESTYLAWTDVRAYAPDGRIAAARLQREGKLRLSPGPDFGPGGEGFLRWNLACPRARLLDAVRRFAAVFPGGA